MTSVEATTPEKGYPCEPIAESYDGHLMDLLRLYWKAGEWKEIVRSVPTSIEEHPDRAALALLLGAAQLQLGREDDGRSWLLKSQHWGCDSLQVARVLVSGVHNSLGRAWAIVGNQERAQDNIERAIGIGARPATTSHFAKERCRSQASQLVADFRAKGVVPRALRRFLKDAYSSTEGDQDTRPERMSYIRPDPSSDSAQGQSGLYSPDETISRESDRYYIRTRNAWNLEKQMPATDFVASAYDVNERRRIEKVLVILSTPRSGSTFLCDLIYRNGLCIPHEYFQPHQYMPILAERWACRASGAKVPLESYVEALVARRTSSYGWLGINVHESHLHVFEKARNSFPGVPCQYVLLSRRDTLAQAVSYEKARQTGKWSSEFSERAIAEYDFESVRKMANRIDEQNRLLEAYCQRTAIEPYRLYYEDLVADIEAETSRLALWLGSPVEFRRQPTLSRQSSEDNERWKLMYMRDLQREYNSGTTDRVTNDATNSDDD